MNQCSWRCETRPVLTDTGQKGHVGHNSHGTPPGWGWVTLLKLPLGQSNNYTISLPPS